MLCCVVCFSYVMGEESKSKEKNEEVNEYRNSKWTCKRCGKINDYGRVYGYWAEGLPDNYKKGIGNEYEIERMKKEGKERQDKEDKEREEFEKKSPEEKKKILKKGARNRVMDERYIAFDDNSYIVDDRIVGEGGEKHKAKFDKNSEYLVFVYNGVAYVCRDVGDSRCKYCYDGGKCKDPYDSIYCIDLSTITKNGGEFCEFGEKSLVTAKKELCCGCPGLVKRTDYKETDLFKKLDKENKWCRFEDCRGVSTSGYCSFSVEC